MRAFAPLNVLVIDDDPMMAQTLAAHFSDQGFQTTVTANGQEALQYMERQLPDLVLCDRRMPEMSGAELLKTIRERDADWQKMAFVFVTGLTDERDIYAMLPLNPDGYICKPFDFDNVDKELSMILKIRGARN